MTNNNFDNIELLTNIQQMIEKNLCSIDGFFTDSRTAATQILQYLQREQIIIKNEGALEIRLSERSKAA